MKIQMQTRLSIHSIVFVLFAGSLGAYAQSAPIPVKPGLWETQVSMTRVTTLPPDAEAKIAALPPAQQAQVRSMMGGAGGSTPTVMTRQVCVAPQTTLDSMLSRAQQTPGSQCSVSNREQTATGASFDITCTMQMGSAKGHTEIRILDDDHASSTVHMTMTGTSEGKTMNSTMDSTTTAKFVAADCGNVKPYTPPAAAK